MVYQAVWGGLFHAAALCAAVFAFVVLPVFIAFGLSFTNYNMFRAPSFVGLQNYRLLLVEDKIFWTAMRNTMIFAGIVGPLGYFCSFFSAWVLNQLKFRNVFALIFYAPSICSGVAISAVWLYSFPQTVTALSTTR